MKKMVACMMVFGLVAAFQADVLAGSGCGGCGKAKDTTETTTTTDSEE